MADDPIRLNEGFERQLGKRLRELRRTGGYRLAQVAEATGISTSFISHIENGKSDITFMRLDRLIVGAQVSEAPGLPGAMTRRFEAFERNPNLEAPIA